VADAVRIVWGPELSPFLLKLESLLWRAGVVFRRLPRDGSRLENLRVSLLVDRATRRRTALRPPANDALDEYPLVPFLVTPAKEVLYDSSALARWLDECHPSADRPLLPGAPAERFVCSFIDEAFDEFGLYMVHHNRWKLAAGDNDHPGHRLAREYAKQIPPGLGRAFGNWFERRQVRRLPYLFSVAPEGYRVAGLAAALTPPSRADFPSTHALLEQSWERTLAAMEDIFARQPFLLGRQFTLADASAYGQLSMNLTDTAAARRLRELAPRTFAWLEAIRERRHVASQGELSLSPLLKPLLDVLLETFAPLMRANEAAYVQLKTAGAAVFNEKAFDSGLSLYDGELLGHRYRSVVKTFQVRSWRDLRREWSSLDDEARARVAALAGGRDLDAVFAAAG